MTKIYALKALKKKYYLKKLTQNYKKLRLSIFKSNKHLYGQVINDSIGKTLASCNTLNKYIAKSRQYFKFSLQKASFLAGQILGKKLVFIGVTNVVLDRKKLIFHGCVKNFILGIHSTGIKV